MEDPAANSSVPSVISWRLIDRVCECPIIISSQVPVVMLLVCIEDSPGELEDQVDQVTISRIPLSMVVAVSSIIEVELVSARTVIMIPEPITATSLFLEIIACVVIISRVVVSKLAVFKLVLWSAGGSLYVAVDHLYG